MENYPSDDDLQTYFASSLAEDTAFTTASTTLGLSDGQYTIAGDVPAYAHQGGLIT